jgi:hypothetical protein
LPGEGRAKVRIEGFKILSGADGRIVYIYKVMGEYGQQVYAGKTFIGKYL